MTPLKIGMLIFLLVTEIPAAIFLIIAWKKDCKEAKKRKENDYD